MSAVVLHIAECPNWSEAGRRLAHALAAVERSDEVQYFLVADEDAATRTGFAGSPTLLIDGTDLFPDGAPTAALACRVYRTPTGLAGLPTTNQIEDALARL